MFFTTEKITLNKERNITLVTMLQSVGGEFERIDKRPAILILPGGGYSMCSDREAEVIAYPFLYAGYHAFVLRYFRHTLLRACGHYDSAQPKDHIQDAKAGV